MYMEHFKLNQLPFSLTPNTHFYCDLPTHQQALSGVLLGLQQRDGLIKIIGDAGTGKTLLCQLLLNNLDDRFQTVYIPNPDQNGFCFLRSLAYELGLSVEKDLPQQLLLEQIAGRLLEIHQRGKQTVVIVDDSQVLPTECLDAVFRLTNLESEERKLMQVVLFGQPKLDDTLSQHGLRQIKQRITHAYCLKPLDKKELDVYLSHRLVKAGYTYGNIFSMSAKKSLFRASGGLPQLLNVLCHKALLISYGRGLSRVDAESMRRAIGDIEHVRSIEKQMYSRFSHLVLALSTGLLSFMAWVVYHAVVIGE